MRLLFAIFLALSLRMAPASAEDRTIAGVSFQVDEISPIDATSVKVSLGDESRIVEASAVNDFIVEKYFSDHRFFSRLTFENIQSFIIESVTSGGAPSALRALSGLLKFTDPSDPRISELIDRLGEEPKSVPVLKGILGSMTSNFPSSRVVCSILYAVGSRDMEWLRQHAVKMLYVFGGELRLFLKERFYRALSDISSTVPEQTVKFYGDAFGVEDPEYKRLSVILVKVEQLRDGLKSNDLARVFPLVDLADEDPAVKNILSPILIDAVHRGADQLLKAGDPKSALALIARLEFERRTPSTHALVTRALSALEIPSPELLRNSALVELLVRLSEKDGQIKDGFVDFLSRGATFYIHETDLESGDAYIRTLRRVRNDPNPENDELRINQAIELLRRGEVGEADRRLADLGSGLTMFQTIRVGCVRLASATTGRLTLAILAILILGLLGMKYAHKIPAVSVRQKDSERPAEMTEEDFEKIRPQFVTLRGQADSSYREYDRCLQVFGLRRDAELKDIKAAYRRMIKTIHPDHQQGTIDPEKFIEIKGAYEQLLELRKTLGFDRDDS